MLCCCGNKFCNSSVVPTPGSTNYGISITPGSGSNQFYVNPNTAPTNLEDYADNYLHAVYNDFKYQTSS